MYLSAGRLLDVYTGEYMDNPLIYIRDGTILHIDEYRDENIPNLVDLGEEITLVPGLIDCHTHITDFATRKNQRTPDEKQRVEENAYNTLMAGFTSIRDLGDDFGLSKYLKDNINRGNILGPRIQRSGRPIFPPDVKKGNIKEFVRSKVEDDADWIKVFNEDEDVISTNKIREIVMSADKVGLPVTCHAFIPKTIRSSVLGGTRSIEHGSFIDTECIYLMRERGTFLIPTLSNPHHYLSHIEELNLPKDMVDFFVKVSSNNVPHVSQAYTQGVKIAYGTDAVVGMHGKNASEFKELLKLGMSPLETIQAATLTASELLCCDHLVGTIEPGKVADIIGVYGDPTFDVEVFSHVPFVMKDGYIVKSEM